MNEGKTTAIFAVVAAISFGLAVWSRPGVITDESEYRKGKVGKAIFAEFDDPDAATSLEIVKFDEELASLERFEVAKDPTSGLWKIPSFDDYPADAEEQVRDATTPLIGLPVLDVPSGDRGDHALYGVVNPDDEDLSVTESGVGMLVSVKDAEDKVLASLIIGKEVEDVENQRYVRVPTEDAVYKVELDTAPFTTDFDKWINSKLLDIRSFDISNIGLRDYAVFPMQTGGYGMRRNFDADVSYNASDSKWSLGRLVTYTDGNPTETPLAEGEELQDQALNDLRNAVQDLEIVGVRRKPEGLASDLKADKSLMDNQESLNSLYAQGFFPQQSGDGYEIFSTGGETIIGTDDGVQYKLRFGESDASLGSDESESEDGTESEGGLRRFLLVTASVDEAKFPYPDLEVRPETVEEMLANRKAAELPAEETQPEAEAATDGDMTETPATQPTGDEPAAEDPAADQPADETPGEPKEETPASEEPADPQSNEETPKAEDPKSEAPKTEEPAEEAPASDGGKADGNSGDGSSEDPSLDDCGAPYQEDESEQDGDAPEQDEPQQAGEDDSAAGDAAVETTPADDAAEPTREELEEELLAVQERINRDNQRKLDERAEQMSDATKKAQELNARFSAWYYVVSDSVYKKLKVSKEQLIKSAEAPAAPGLGGLPSLGPGAPGQGAPGVVPPGFQVPPQQP
ncbi:MAG: DUF4340 domain-containing protein [Aureliella sp.]